MIHPAWLLGIAVWTQAAPPPSAASLAKDLRTLRANEAGRLGQLADRLATSGLNDEAAEVRARIEPVPPRDGPTRIEPLAEVVPPKARGLANVPTNGPQPPPWKAELQAARTATAESLIALATRAAKAEHFTLAGECLRACVDREPDHKEARRLLGYVPHQGGWATPFAVRMMTKEKKVLDPTYGWVDETWIPHLQRGELPAPILPGREVQWLPADRADALRQDFAHPWTINTEHFQIRTNVTLAEAITFGRQLEAFYDVFFALMADAIDPRYLPLAQRFRNPTLTATDAPKTHRVWYFATKDEYVEYLRNRQGPDVGNSLGIYLPPRDPRKRGEAGTCYFFRDIGGQLDVTATLYHEASHQLLFETGGPASYVNNRGDFWVFEGLGTYFETLTPQPDGSILVGGLVGPRIEQARLRLLDQGEFIPIGTLVAMDKARFNDDLELFETGDVYLHYAEAMALTVFLMQYDGGRYREPFFDYVKDAYKGRIKRGAAKALGDRLGVPYATLDRQLLGFLKAGVPEIKPQ